MILFASSRFDDSLATFKSVAARRFGSSGGSATPVVHFVWVNADRQEDFMDGFGVESLPSVLAVNPRKKRYRYTGTVR